MSLGVIAHYNHYIAPDSQVNPQFKRPRSPHTPAAHPPTRNKLPASSIGAAQLSITALFQKLGAQGKQTRKRQPLILPEQQLSLFGTLAAAD